MTVLVALSLSLLVCNVNRYLRNAQVSQLTHPLPVMRAREIEQWSRSPEYKKLIKRGRHYGSRDEEV